MIGRCGDTAGDGEGVALIEDLVGWDLGVAAVDGRWMFIWKGMPWEKGFARRFWDS